MADPRRGWLALQRDLGGDEVIFDTAIDLAAVLAPRPREAAPVVATPPRPVAKGARAAAASAATTPLSAPAAVTQVTPVNPLAVAAALRANSVAVSEDESETSWRRNLPPIPGPGFTVHPPPGGAWETLDEIAEIVRICTMCPLCSTRTLAVPGEGNPQARLMVIGEGPGDTEDKTGRPFVGRAGELLDKMLLAIEVPRATVFIANVVKCRPPQNRVPLPDERESCLPYLRRQIELIQPTVILALGGTAAEALLGVKKPLGELRLKIHQWGDIPLVVTYHPAALLRNPNWKRPAWDDVRIARQLLDAST